jgi:hypothetical protein
LLSKKGIDKSMRVPTQYITSPTWRKNKAQHEQQRREAEQEDKEAAAKRKQGWDMNSRTPMILTLHRDQGRIPGGVRLQIDDNEASRSIIHRRAARLTGDLNAEPDAVLETSLEEISEEVSSHWDGESGKAFNGSVGLRTRRAFGVF